MELRNLPFVPADILLPRGDFEKWACVACDQFTSEPEYWLEAERFVGDAPSALKCILPEVWLGKDDDKRIAAVNAEMEKYLRDGIFAEYPGSMIYVERTLPDGGVRRGVVGAVDLEEYDFSAGSRSPVRATEATVLSRIPPRVAIRRDAPIELPHIMLLADDPADSVIGQFEAEKEKLPLLYDFDLMQGGGHISGRLLDGEAAGRVVRALSALAEKLPDGGILIAVGDGNHSLATAKECCRLNPVPRNRYAIAELVNLHDPSLVFEPIYRVVFNCDPAALVAKAEKELSPGKNAIEWHSASGEGRLSTGGLPADTLQRVIDDYVAATPGAYCDYVHGEESARSLGKGAGAVAFLFDGMDKNELFPYVQNVGPLPRKTFSMGEAKSKRYYVEARRINA